MLTPENREMPDWAHQERDSDLEWIRENTDSCQLAAGLGYEEIGRGAINVDTTTQFEPEGGHPFGYLSNEQLNEEDEDTRRMVQEYIPTIEFVLVLPKSEERSSTYRVRMQWRREGSGG